MTYVWCTAVQPNRYLLGQEDYRAREVYRPRFGVDTACCTVWPVVWDTASVTEMMVLVYILGHLRVSLE